MRTVVSLHDMVKVKEESLEKKVKESNVIETSSDDDDFYMLFWVVCWSKQERSVHTEPHTRPSSRVLCSGGSRDWIGDPTIDKCDPKSLHNTLSPRSYSSPSSYYRTKRSSPTHIPTFQPGSSPSLHDQSASSPPSYPGSTA